MESFVDSPTKDKTWRSMTTLHKGSSKYIPTLAICKQLQCNNNSSHCASIAKPPVKYLVLLTPQSRQSIYTNCPQV